MKKFTSFIYGIVLLTISFSFTGCDQSTVGTSGGGSGTSAPGKKISQVYYWNSVISSKSDDDGDTWTTTDYTVGERQLNEEWYWNGDKISRIHVNSDEKGVKHGTYYFEFNNNDLVSKITNHESDIEYCFTYSGNKISQLDSYKGDDHQRSKYYYTGNKLTKMVITDDKKSGSSIVEFKWTGNNITWAKATIYGIFVEYFELSYDNKYNPYYGNNSLTAWTFSALSLGCYSYNNCTHAVMTGIDDEEEIITMIYDSDNYPITIEETEYDKSYKGNILVRETEFRHYDLYYLDED